MSDATVASVASQVVATDAKAKATPKKKAAAGNKAIKKTSDHPKYSEMVHQALASLKERGGSSRQAVLKYIMKNFSVGTDESVVNTHLKVALRSGVKNASLKQSKGSGASGSFRLGEEAKKPKATKAKAPKKPAAAKKPAKAAATKSPKKIAKKATAAATKKPKAAAAKPVKKAKADKPKKAATPKKVAKAAAKPKKAASPAKKAKPVAVKKAPAAAKPKKAAVAKKPAASAKKA